jgi:hypothetical protein
MRKTVALLLTILPFALSCGPAQPVQTAKPSVQTNAEKTLTDEYGFERIPRRYDFTGAHSDEEAAG